MDTVSAKKNVCIILLHNRKDTGLYNYALIYKKAYPQSTIYLMSDLYPNVSQWAMLFLFFRYKSRIKKQIKKELIKYDLVHICDNPAYSFKILKLFHKYKIKTIYTLHDPKCHLENSFKNKLKNQMEISFFNRTFRIISKSPYIVLHLHYMWSKLNSLRPVILPHPIYPLEQDNLKMRNNTITLTIGYFGRLQYYKGFDIFQNLILRLDELVPKNRIKVIIAGDGQINPIKALKNIAIELHNGFIEDGLFDTLINNCDLVLLPYRQASQSGILMKAMTFNVPVIASNLEELTSYINPGLTGLVIDIADIQQWIEKLIYYSNNINELHLMSQNIKNLKHQYEPSFIANILYQ